LEPRFEPNSSLHFVPAAEKMGCTGSSNCFAGLVSGRPTAEADVLVVGAGPAGIAAVVALQQRRRVVWVDPEFQSGRLKRFLTVPCNTKVDILASESNFRHPLLQHVGGSVAPALQKLIADAESLPGSTDPSQLGWTTLGACKRMFDAITSGALQAGGLSRCFGKVLRLTHDGAHWVATVDSQQGQKCVKVRCVVLATGAEPKAAPVPNALSAEKTFDEDSLRQHLRPNQRLAVLGNSHTAAVALAKLGELAVPMSLSITCFARRPLRCAEWLEHSQVYRYNSTGLKGFGAVFGRECMIHGTSWLQVKDVKDFSPEHWDWIIDCTGYVKSQLPAIDGVTKAQDLPRDEASGALLGAPPGLFALGVPWGEAPGRLWGRGLEAEDGFRGEDTFVGFSMFFARASLIANEIGKVLDCSCKGGCKDA